MGVMSSSHSSQLLVGTTGAAGAAGAALPLFGPAGLPRMADSLGVGGVPPCVVLGARRPVASGQRAVVIEVQAAVHAEAELPPEGRSLVLCEGV